MKTSNKILLIGYAVIVLALSVMVFSSRNLVERAILGTGNQSFMVK
jgi:hypothetical protein